MNSLEIREVVICARCGHAEQQPQALVYAHAVYPARQVWVPSGEFEMPEVWRCPECHNSDDVVLFGKGFIHDQEPRFFGARNVGQMDLIAQSNAFFYLTAYGRALSYRSFLPAA